jgi:hypothetical protein
MTSGDIRTYLVTWSVVGCIVFSAYVVMVYRTGLVYAARKTDGTLKEHVPLSGYVNMLVFLVMIVGFQAAANDIGLARQGYKPGLGPLYLLNLAHYAILFLFDSLVIDAFVLGLWRPRFLRLPEATGRASMRRHILLSIPVGIAGGVLLAGASTAVSHLAFF